MTSAHMLFGCLALSPMMLLNETYAARHASVLRNDWKGLLTIAVMNGVQIALNNASLTVMELSMNQVIRACIPVVVALLAVCIEGKVPSKSEMVCLIVIALGVMLAVWEESRNAVLGIALTCISSLMQSVQMSVSGKIMSGKSGKLDSFQMTFYTGPAAFISLAPFAFATEYSIMATSLSERPGVTIGFLLGSCCVAVVYNVVLFQAVRTLSSVGTAILGNVKIVMVRAVARSPCPEAHHCAQPPTVLRLTRRRALPHSPVGSFSSSPRCCSASSAAGLRTSIWGACSRSSPRACILTSRRAREPSLQLRWLRRRSPRAADGSTRGSRLCEALARCRPGVPWSRDPLTTPVRTAAQRRARGRELRTRRAAGGRPDRLTRHRRRRRNGAC